MISIPSILIYASVLTAVTSQINLSYQPIKPFYWPQNFVYPQPVISPGTPWPASRTTTDDHLKNTQPVFTPASIQINEITRLTTSDSFNNIESSTSTTKQFFDKITNQSQHQPEEFVTTQPQILDKFTNIIDDSTFVKTSTDSLKATNFITEVRVKPETNKPVFNPDRIVFPDQFRSTRVPINIQPTNIPASLPPRIAETEYLNSTEVPEKHLHSGEISVAMAMNYIDEIMLLQVSKPTAGATETPKQENTPIILDYKPIRPFYVPNPVFYPQPSIPSGTPWPPGPEGANTETSTTFKLEEKITAQITSTTEPSTLINLEFKPSRPPYVPNPVFYPEPSIFPSGTNPILVDKLNLQLQSTNLPINSDLNPTLAPLAVNKTDSPISSAAPATPTPEKPTTDSSISSVQQTSPISLEYKPSRPPFYPDSVVHPQPSFTTEKPNLTSSQPSLLETSNITLSNKVNVEKDTHHTVVSSETPVNIVTEKLNENITSIVLGYIPTRPFYAPNPVFYPQSSIPAGTPWPSKPQDKLTTTVISSSEITSAGPPQKLPTTQSSTIINLEYESIRPPYVPNPVFYPESSIYPSNTNLTVEDKFNQQPQSTILHNNSIASQNSKPTILLSPSTETLNVALPNKSEVLTQQNGDKTTPINLEYVPSRPPYIPQPIFYPQPVLIPDKSTTIKQSDTFSSSQETTISNYNDLTTNKQVIITTLRPNVQKQTTSISLEYKPSLPSFLPYPWVYPQPSILPGTPWPAISTTKPIMSNENLV